jgi:hypothetical protein
MPDVHDASGNATREDPVQVAQSLFSRFEERKADTTPARLDAVLAPPQPPSAVDRAELLAVVQNLELVTTSLIATSQALAEIGRALADEADASHLRR